MFEMLCCLSFTLRIIESQITILVTELLPSVELRQIIRLILTVPKVVLELLFEILL